MEWPAGREISSSPEGAALRGISIAVDWPYTLDAAIPRTLFAYVGAGESRNGKLCHVIRRAGIPYAYSPELVMYLGQDDSNFVDARQGDSPFDPLTPPTK